MDQYFVDLNFINARVQSKILDAGPWSPSLIAPDR